MNKSGPKTEPWGTPDRTLHGELNAFPSTTCCFLRSRKSFIQLVTSTLGSAFMQVAQLIYLLVTIALNFKS